LAAGSHRPVQFPRHLFQRLLKLLLLLLLHRHWLAATAITLLFNGQHFTAWLLLE
jgi:hypothetical protein